MALYFKGMPNLTDFYKRNLLHVILVRIIAPCFNEDLKLVFSNTDIQTCEEFEEIFMNLLDHHASLEKKILRANIAPYITKKLRKAILKRSHLEKIHWKTLAEKSLNVYKK